MERLKASRLSKFRILDHPDALPNKCAGCGIGHGGDGITFVDLSLDVDYYGVVYTCSRCFLEIANLLGYAAYDQQQEIEAMFKELYETCNSLRAENEHLRSTVADLANHRCGSFSGITPIPFDDGSVPKGNGESETRDIVDGSDDSATGQRESTPIENGEDSKSDSPEHPIVEGSADTNGDAKRDNRKSAKPRDIADEI